MLVLADYDDIRSMSKVSLNLLEVLIAMKGLQVAIWTEGTLFLLGMELGSFVRVDSSAVKRKEIIQRV